MTNEGDNDVHWSSVPGDRERKGYGGENEAGVGRDRASTREGVDEYGYLAQISEKVAENS